MKIPDTTLHGSICVILLLIGFATSAAGQGTSGPVIGGESRGITEIRGKILCLDCRLTLQNSSTFHAEPSAFLHSYR